MKITIKTDEKEMRNTVVIVHAEGRTCALINGKCIGKKVSRLAFEHVASEPAKIELDSVDLIDGVGTVEKFQKAARDMGFVIVPVDELLKEE